MAAFAQQAVEAAVNKQSTKLAATEQQAATTTDSRQRTELEGAVKNEQHKLKQVQEVVAQLQQLLAGGVVSRAFALWFVGRPPTQRLAAARPPLSTRPSQHSPTLPPALARRRARWGGRGAGGGGGCSGGGAGRGQGQPGV